MPRQCDVCYGTPGKYPVIDRFGSQRYEITCPECIGLGTVPDESDEPSEVTVRRMRTEDWPERH